MSPAVPRGSSALSSAPPDPRRYDTWQAYALALGGWQDQQRLLSMSTQPEAVLLVSAQTTGTPSAHNRPPGMARATADGLLVFDPSTMHVRVSYGAAWHSLLAEGDVPTGPFVPAAGGTFTGDVVFGSGLAIANAVAATPADLSQHIELYAGYGFNVTSNNLDYVAPATAFHTFYRGAVQVGRVEAGGTGLPDTFSFVTREKGDARYVDKVSAGVQSILGDLYAGPFNLAVDTTAARYGAGACYVQTSSSIPASTPAIAVIRGAGTPVNVFQVTRAGAVQNVTGTITVISDAAEKDAIEDMPPTLGQLSKLRAVRYTLRDVPEAGTLPGFVAQEVAEVFPELIDEVNRETDDDKPPDIVLGVKWSHLVPMLVRAAQELAARVAALEERTP